MPKEVKVSTILNKTKRRDPWFLDDYTVNPFSACSFNCLYCYIRGSKYGPSMEEALRIKINAPLLLSKALAQRAARDQYGIIVLSSSTDPYLKIEEEIGLTRKLLETIEFYRFPVHVITKSPLVLRDMDLLHQIKQQAILPTDLKQKVPGAFITFSFSTLDDKLAKIFEPGAPAPTARLEAIKQLKQSGHTAGVSFMPLLPYLSDSEEHLDAAFRTFKELNVDYVMPASLSLFGNGKADSRTLVFNAISKHFPELRSRYQELFQGSERIATNYRLTLEEKLMLLNQKYNLPARILDTA